MKTKNKDYEIDGFYLDQFEVTVGRFRRYMDAVDEWMAAGNPVEGAGAHPRAPESGFKREWLEDLDPLIADGVRPGWFGATVESGPLMTMANPTFLFGERDDLSVNRVPFHVAFAFCIWDGGRLPTALEWKYTAQGGPLMTLYPWGDSPTPAEVFATFPPLGEVPDHLAMDQLWKWISIPVGSHPATRGVFGHQDLVGGLSEWLRDDYPYSITTFDEWVYLDADLIEKTAYNTNSVRRYTIGWPWEFLFAQQGIEGGWTAGHDPFSTGETIQGFRCARDPQ